MLSFYIWQLHVNTLGTISFHREWQFHKGLYDTCNYMHLQGLNSSAYNKKRMVYKFVPKNTKLVVIGTLYTLSISTGIDQLRGGTHCDCASTLYCSTSNAQTLFQPVRYSVHFNDCSDNGFTQPAAAGMHWSPNCGSGHTEADLGEGSSGALLPPP